MNEQNQDNILEEKKGFSWMSLFFAPYYYAGYGKIGKGIVYGIIALIPLIGLIAYIYSGFNAKKELAIGKVKFKWINVIGVFVLQVIIFASYISIFDNNNDSNNNSSNTTTNIEIVKNGLSVDYKSITIGQVFDNWKQCEDIKWRDLITDNGINIIEMNCNIALYGKKKQQSNILKLEESIKTTEKLVQAAAMSMSERYMLKVIELRNKLDNERDTVLKQIVVQWTINVDNTFDLTYTGFIISNNDKDEDKSINKENLLEFVYDNKILN